jgi:hypothetical protein
LALIISVKAKAQPKERAINLNGKLEIPAMGANSALPFNELMPENTN